MPLVSPITVSQIGCKLGKPSEATRNSVTLRNYLDSKQGQYVDLSLKGDLYIDGSQPIKVIVANSGLAGFWLRGPGRIFGIMSSSPTTPVLTILRGAGTVSPIVLKDFEVSSENGSGILWLNGGSLSLMDGVVFKDITGGNKTGDLDYEDFDDVVNNRCSYALRVDDSDGLFVERSGVVGCAGHGVVCTRWHAGSLEFYARECAGSGFKLQQANGLKLDARSESNYGYGIHARDCGIDCYENHKMRANSGASDTWQIWCEANNGRGIVGSHGFRFSQMKLENVANHIFSGHTGWTDNMVRIDACSRDLNHWLEEVKIPAVRADRELDSSVAFPHDNYGDKRVTNWDKVWPDKKFRPTVGRTGSGIIVTWPIDSLDNAVLNEVAYWNPFGLNPLASPGTFVYSATVSDATGRIIDYCIRREADSPRQSPCAGVFVISPVAGAITGVALWDKMPHRFSGAITVTDGRKDIGLHVNAWVPGMQNVGHAPQTAEHILEISDLRLWKL